VTTRPGDPASGPTRAGELCGSPKKGGGTCANRAGKGTDHVGHGHCRYHGGNSPGGVKMADRELAYATARTLHLPADDPDADPSALMLALVREQAGIVAWLREEVGKLTPEALVRGTRYVRRTTTTVGQFPGETTVTEAGQTEHVLSVMYARERRIYADVLAKVIAAGIAQRHVDLAEQQGELAGRLVTGILSDLGVDPASPRARDVIRRHFTLISGGAS
jgi:hypothetical protein